MAMTRSIKTERQPWIVRHWLLLINLAIGLFTGGTLLPPVLMRLGFEGAARILYGLYGLTCHQLPQRSYFLFGPNGLDSYSEAQVLAWGADPAHLRAFVGNLEVGFKLGMAGRNTAIYSGLLLAGLAFGLLRRRVTPFRWPLFVLLIAPMALDGGSHLISELTGLGFRATNTWLVALFGDTFPSSFYAGTVIGSFNWFMRTLTGGLFGAAVVAFVYPHIERAMAITGADALSGEPVGGTCDI